jgi:DNA-binding transcriptional MocR family regulator
VDSLQRECGSLVRVIGNSAGMHLAVTLPKSCHDGQISLRAAEQSLWLWPLSPSYIAKPTQQGFILGFGSTPAAEIPTAVGHLHKLIS